jgi:hypothetical protein
MITANQIKVGQTLVYDDGREGHQGVKALVLETQLHSFTVQFEDRADTDWIKYSDKAWMDYLTPSPTN